MNTISDVGLSELVAIARVISKKMGISFCSKCRGPIEGQAMYGIGEIFHEHCYDQASEELKIRAEQFK